MRMNGDMRQTLEREFDHDESRMYIGEYYNGDFDHDKSMINILTFRNQTCRFIETSPVLDEHFGPHSQ